MPLCVGCGKFRMRKNFQNKERDEICKYCDERKNCEGCGFSIRKEHYGDDSSTDDGKSPYCKECLRLKSHRWTKRNPEARKANVERYRRRKGEIA